MVRVIGETWGPRRECSFPQFICSRRGPAGHSGSPEVCWLGIRPSKRLRFQVDCFVTCWAVAMATPVSFTRRKIIH